MAQSNTVVTTPFSALQFNIALGDFEINMLSDGPAIANQNLNKNVKPNSYKPRHTSAHQSLSSSMNSNPGKAHFRSRVVSDSSIMLINHNAKEKLSLTPSDGRDKLNKLRRPNHRMSLGATMTDLHQNYISPLRSNPELADSVPNTPRPVEWHRTLLHLAAESGVTVKIREYIEEECAGKENAKRQLEMAGDAANGDRPLHLAVKHGHYDAAKALIDYGAIIDAPNRYNDTPLILSIKGGYLNCTRLLLDSGADVFVRGRNGQTPFHCAAAFGNIPAFQMLLEVLEKTGDESEIRRAVEAKDFTEDGNNPFHLAALGNHVEICSYLAELRPDLLELKNASLYTALHLAARQGRLEMVKWLVEERKFDIDALGWFNKTPLHKAAEAGQIVVIGYLIEKGADLEAVEFQLGGTPLHVAAMHGRAQAVGFLIEHGADNSKETEMFGFQAIHVAAFYGKTEVIDELNRLGRANVNAKGTIGRTPLILACSGGHIHTVEYLVANGAALEERDEQLGATALHFSAWFGQLAIIEYLLKCGAERSSKDQAGDTPLHWACLAAQPKAVAFLLTRGAETGAKDGRIGRTPLHDAASKGYIEIVQLLLSRADIQAVDEENGATALHIAAWFGQTEVMNLLLSHRARIEAHCHQKCTPIQWAVINNQIDAVRCLLDRGADVNGKGGKYGRTPLHMAAEWGRLEIAELLMSRNANKEIPDDTQQYRPLHLAARYQHPELVELFLSRRANPFAQDEYGHTPLHLAVREGQAGASLLDARKWREAEVKAKTGLGSKTIEDAVTAGRWEMTEDILRSKILNQSPEKRLDEQSQKQSRVIHLLLEHSPDLMRIRTTRFGRTVLHVAAQAGQLNACQTLISMGADPRARDKIGKTPLRLAFDNSKYDIVRLFVKLGIPE